MVHIRVVGTDLVLPTRKDETVLAALHRAGYAFRIGCRRGGCGICKFDLRSGEIDYRVTVSDEVLTPQERALGVALLCRAVPVTDVVIEVPPESRLRCIAPLLTEIACQQREKTSSPATISVGMSSPSLGSSMSQPPEPRIPARAKE